MATNDIGRVTPIWRGFFSPAITYELNDIVIDTAGSVWWHKSAEITTGIAPGSGEIWDAVIDMAAFGEAIQTAIDEAQAAVDRAETAETEIEEAEERATDAADAAQNASEAAIAAVDTIGTYATAAQTAKTAAETAQGLAEDAQEAAEAAEDAATEANTAAQTAKAAAETAQEAAEAAAESVSESAAQIETNRGDIADLKTHVHKRVTYTSDTTLLNVDVPCYMWVSKDNLITLLGQDFPFTIPSTSNWLIIVDKYSGNFRQVQISSSTGTASWIGLTGSSHPDTFTWYNTVDTTLTESGKPADAKAVGAEIEAVGAEIEAVGTEIEALAETDDKIIRNLLDYNVYDLLSDVKPSDGTSQGVKFTWTGHQCVVSPAEEGVPVTPSSTARNIIISSSNPLPNGVTVGEYLLFVFRTTSDVVHMRILFLDSGGTRIGDGDYITTNTVLKVPSGTVKLNIALEVYARQTVSDPVTVSDIAMCRCEFPAKEMKAADLSAVKCILDIPAGMYFSVSGNQIRQIADHDTNPTDVPVGNTIPSGVSSGATYLVRTWKFSGTNGVVYELVRTNGKNCYIGLRSDSHPNYITWNSMVDNTLTEAEKPADAKAVGDALGDIDNTLKTVYKRISYVAPDPTNDIAGTTFLNMPAPSYMYVSQNQLLSMLEGEEYFTYTLPESGYWRITKDYYSGTATGNARVITIEATHDNYKYAGYTSNVEQWRSVFRWSDLSGGSSVENGTVKILAFTSSFGYSTLGYVPQVLAEVLPDVHFIFSICYKSGGSIEDFIDYWDNDTPYAYYSKFDSYAGQWTNTADSITGKQAMDDEAWDIVVLQEYNQDLEYATERLPVFAQKLSLYAKHPLSFLYNMTQSYGIYRGAEGSSTQWPPKYRDSTLYPTNRDKQIALMMDHAEIAQELMEGYYISDVLPTGMAIQNARTTSLDEYGAAADTYGEPGDPGDLCADANGHLQNGIAVLICAYTAVYKFCEFLGFKPKLFAMQYNPTNEDLANIHYYCATAHKSCVGVTDENKLLAQKCALAAIKDPYHITDMSGEEIS